MKRKHLFLTILSLIFILFAVTATYTVMKDNDPYRHFTGLGSAVSVAPDDSSIAFSYYANGEESIYTMNPDGTNVQRITNQVNVRDRNPAYSPDGAQIVYISENPQHTQALKIVDDSGKEGKRLTESDLHVQDAIFSMDGETVFFVAIEAVEFHKGEESREGFDLYSIEKSGTNLQKLTDEDHFSMNQLFLSPDGQSIYYSEFDGQEERIYAYELENETIDKQPSLIPEEVASGQSFYSPQLSPDGDRLAYKAVAKESQETSLFEYELFTLNLTDNNVEKLTDFGKSLSSPVFFHNENKKMY